MTPDDFTELLLWLDPDPDGTGVPNAERGREKYEKIRFRIVKIYSNRKGDRAEDVASETMKRVALKAKKLRLTYQGDPALYFYGVAKRVYLEFLREDEDLIPPAPILAGAERDDREELERRHAWLDDCLAKLKPESRDLILAFYQGEKKEKIDNRKALAAKLKITPRALSLRALHIRQKLSKCMQGYLQGRDAPK